MAGDDVAGSSNAPQQPFMVEDPDRQYGDPRKARDHEPSALDRMCHSLRKMISQKRHRTVYQGLDLDLAYITDRIIAVGYPSKGLEARIRNTMAQTREFLWRRHGVNHVKVFNLRGGFLYKPEKFDNNVIYFDMTDHHPPKLELMAPFCREAALWLEADPENVIAVHCKAGKGRTGVMICAFLIYINFYNNPRQVLDYYSIVRTSNNKGVTIPSQRRYIYYYDCLRRQRLNYFPLRMELMAVYLERPPQTRRGGSKIKIKVANGSTNLFTSGVLNISPNNYTHEKNSWKDLDDTLQPENRIHFISKRAYCFKIPRNNRVFVEGDVRIDLLDNDKRTSFGSDKKIGHVWFNTMFVCEGMCREEFKYGDRKWPYHFVSTSIGKNGPAVEDDQRMFDTSGLTPLDTNWKILKPPGLDRHATEDSLNKIYHAYGMAPPRDHISRVLHEAHHKNIVLDEYALRRNNVSHVAYDPMGDLETTGDVGGPVKVPRNNREHLLTFPVYEIDRALKDKKLDNGMKLHVVLRCIDARDNEQYQLAQSFCDKTFQNEERIARQAANLFEERFRPPPQGPAGAIGAEMKVPPAVRYAENGAYNGVPHALLTDYKFGPGTRSHLFAKSPRWCRYFYKQRGQSEVEQEGRAPSPSRYPTYMPVCTLAGTMFRHGDEFYDPDIDNTRGPSPDGSQRDRGGSPGTSSSQTDDTEPFTSGPSTSAPTPLHQKKQVEKPEEGKPKEGTSEGGGPNVEARLIPLQNVAFTDLNSFDQYPDNDVLLAALRANDRDCAEAEHNRFLTLKKFPNPIKSIKMWLNPDYDSVEADVDDEDFVSRPLEVAHHTFDDKRYVKELSDLFSEIPAEDKRLGTSFCIPHYTVDYGVPNTRFYVPPAAANATLSTDSTKPEDEVDHLVGQLINTWSDKQDDFVNEDDRHLAERKTLRAEMDYKQADFLERNVSNEQAEMKCEQFRMEEIFRLQTLQSRPNMSMNLRMKKNLWDEQRHVPYVKDYFDTEILNPEIEPRGEYLPRTHQFEKLTRKDVGKKWKDRCSRSGF